MPPGHGTVPPPPYGGHGPVGGYGAYGGGPYGGAPYGQPPAPRPGVVPLRPLSAGEILDGSFTAIRWNPKALLPPSAVVAATTAVLIGLASYYVERQILTGVRVSGTGPSVSAAQAVGLIALGSLTYIVVGFANLVLTGLVTVTVGQAALGRKETLTSAWRATRPWLWRLIAMLLLVALVFIVGIALVTGLSVGIGLLAGSAAGIVAGVVCGLTAWVFAAIALVRWSLAIPVVMLEQTGPLKSLRRSWRLVKRSSWRVLGILLLTGLIVAIANEIINLPFTLGGGAFSSFSFSPQAHVNVGGLFLTAIGQIISGTLTAPLLAGVIVLLYADLRMRREGMDITLRGAAAGAVADDRPGGQNASPW